MKSLLSSYINPLLKEGVDCLVLGCTHYPYLIPQIRELVGDKIEIIDSGQAVAKQTKVVLEKHQLVNTNDIKGKHQFYINKNKDVLSMMISEKNNFITIDERDF